MFQQVSIIGNLGRDPEMRYLPSGQAVTDFSVAVNRRWTNRDGQPGEETVWFRVSAFGRQGEVAAQYLKKGRQVFVQGRIKEPRIWTDRDGNPRASLELVATDIQFLGGRDDAASSGDYSGGSSAPDFPQDEEDLPF